MRPVTAHGAMPRPPDRACAMTPDLRGKARGSRLLFSWDHPYPTVARGTFGRQSPRDTTDWSTLSLSHLVVYSKIPFKIVVPIVRAGQCLVPMRHDSLNCGPLRKVRTRLR